MKDRRFYNELAKKASNQNLPTTLGPGAKAHVERRMTTTLVGIVRLLEHDTGTMRLRTSKTLSISVRG